MMDALRTENAESLMSSIQDIAAKNENAGRMGSGTWRAMDRGAREESMESLDQASAGLMSDSRKQALALQQAILGMTNERDLGALREATNMAGIQASSNSAASGYASQQDAMRLQAAAQLMDAAKFGLSFQGDMSGQLQQGQLGALQGLLGFGQLDLDKTNSAANIGNSLGLGSLGFGFGVEQSRAAARRAAEQDQWNREYSGRQESRQGLFDILSMIQAFGGMGGQTFSQGNGQYTPEGMDPNIAGLIGAFGGGIGGYNAGADYFKQK